VLGQEDHRVGHGLGGGVRAGGRELRDVQGDLRGGQGPGPVLIPGGGHHRDDVIGVGVPAGVDDLSQHEVGPHEALPHLGALRLGQRLVGGGEHREEVVAEPAQHRLVLVAQAQQRHDRLGGELQRVLLEQVRGALGLEPVDDPVRAGLDLRLEPVHALLDEAALGHGAGLGVAGRVLAHDHPGHELGRVGLPVLLGDVGRGVGRRGVGPPVREHREAVLALRDDPGVEVGVPEHRGRVPDLGQVPGGVAVVVVPHGVEAVGDGAAAGGAGVVVHCGHGRVLTR
jgi:hypothetical protein